MLEVRGKVGARLFFRSPEQLTNAISVRDDVMDGRDAGMPVGAKVTVPDCETLVQLMC